MRGGDGELKAEKKPVKNRRYKMYWRLISGTNVQGLGSTLPKAVFWNARSSGPEEAGRLLGEENFGWWETSPVWVTKILTKWFHHQKTQPFYSTLRAGGTSFLPLYKPSQKTEAFCVPSEGCGTLLQKRTPAACWKDGKIKRLSSRAHSWVPSPSAEGAHWGRARGQSASSLLSCGGSTVGREADAARSEVRKECGAQTPRDRRALLETPPKRWLDAPEGAVPARSSAPPPPPGPAPGRGPGLRRAGKVGHSEGSRAPRSTARGGDEWAEEMVRGGREKA